MKGQLPGQEIISSELLVNLASLWQRMTAEMRYLPTGWLCTTLVGRQGVGETAAKAHYAPQCAAQLSRIALLSSVTAQCAARLSRIALPGLFRRSLDHVSSAHSCQWVANMCTHQRDECSGTCPRQPTLASGWPICAHITGRSVLELVPANSMSGPSSSQLDR